MKKRLFFLAVILLTLLLFIFGLRAIKAKISCPFKLAGASGLVNQAKSLEAKGDLGQARVIYKKLISDFSDSHEAINWQKRIEDLNIKILFSPRVSPESVLYEVKPADNLAKIAREFKTTVELIKKSNNLASDTILPGRKIKVWNVPFSIVVDKSQNILILKAGEEAVKTYVVATGLNNSTPTGTFKIVNKLINPTWFRVGSVVPAGSPENILGSRWMGFNLAGYGIHGATDTSILGKQATQGCVRMSNSDVEELYLIIPPGTEVTIID